MKRSHNLLTSLVALIAGLFFLAYIIYIIFMAFKLVEPRYLSLVFVTIREIPFILAVAIIFPVLYMLYSRTFLYREREARGAIHLKELVFFILYSLLLFCLIALSLRIMLDMRGYLFSKIVIIILLYFLSLYPLYLTGHFIARLFIFNFFFSLTRGPQDMERNVYPLLEMESFLEHCENNLNQCRRYNINSGFIALHIPMMDEIRMKYGEKGAGFLRKQLIFIISGSSRSYEPWGRTQEKDIYINIVQVRDTEQLKSAEDRFRHLVEQHEFTIFDKKIQPDLRLASVFIDVQTIHATPEEPDREQLRKILMRLVEDLKKAGR